MEPRLGSRGKAINSRLVRPPRQPSMEPRLGSRGKSPIEYHCRSASNPSMEPRLGSRGKIESHANALAIYCLQWSRDLEVAESTKSDRGEGGQSPFNGAATWKSRKVRPRNCFSNTRLKPLLREPPKSNHNSIDCLTPSCSKNSFFPSVCRIASTPRTSFCAEPLAALSTRYKNRIPHDLTRQ